MLIPFKTLISKYQLQVKGVLHIGAHIGQEAADYAAEGIDEMIFIEAMPSTYVKLMKNLVKYPKAIGINACCSDVDVEPVAFHVSSNDGQSSSMLEPGTHLQAHPEVKFNKTINLLTSRADSLLKEYDMSKYNFLNIDVQGAEGKVLKGLGNLLHGFDYVYVEVNKEYLYVGCSLFQDVAEYLSSYGFDHKETVWTTWNWGDSYFQRQIVNNS